MATKKNAPKTSIKAPKAKAPTMSRARAPSGQNQLASMASP